MEINNNVIIKQYLIAGGNSTIIAWNCPSKERTNLVNAYLGNVEQVGFASNNMEIPSFTMMGNEFSGNGTLAFASTLDKAGTLKTSGIRSDITYTNSFSQTSITYPLQYSLDNNIILLEGIGYLYTDKNIKVSPKMLRYLTNFYNLPAFGIATFIKGKLVPYVFVKKTNSIFEETSCGSGSIAVSIKTGLKSIKQPTGEYITVNISNNIVTLEAKVTEITEAIALQNMRMI
jgi:hypothetical protein